MIKNGSKMRKNWEKMNKNVKKMRENDFTLEDFLSFFSEAP